MQARVVVYQDGKQTFRVPVESAGAGIGRDSGNEVQLSSPEVSKRHAFLRGTAQGWFVKDLNSRNGLFVNGRKVSETALADGDKLHVGPYLLVFEIEGAEKPYKPVVNIDMTPQAAQQTIPAKRIQS